MSPENSRKPGSVSFSNTPIDEGGHNLSICPLPDLHGATPLEDLLAVAAFPALLLKLCFAVQMDPKILPQG